MIELPVPDNLQLRKEPKQKRTHALLEQILVCTATLVREQGYQSVNTNSIAQKAGIDVKSLYEFFPNKEAILYRLADQWLLALRRKCQSFDAPEHLDKPWREFFLHVHQSVITESSYADNFISLHGLWDLLPPFSRLDEFHQQFLMKFYLRHFKRFGCKAPLARQKAICTFLLALEDGIGANLVGLSAAQHKSLWALQYDTQCFHLQQILPE